MKKILFNLWLVVLITSCEHSGYDVTKMTGDYRYYAGIAEFFDCDSQINYYVDSSGISDKLQALYSTLKLKEKEDIYIEVEGYYKEQKQMDGVDPITVFVPVELLSYDSKRGCKQAIRQGH